MITKQYNNTNYITGLRAIAILLVFLIHSLGAEIGEYSTFTKNFVNFGKYGVQIFFVISGFTIFYQILNNKYTFRKFLLVRIVRLSIVYFPIIIIFYLFNLYTGYGNYWLHQFNEQGVITIQNLLAHFFYLGYLDEEYANSIIGVEWTLNIEVFYYILFGYLISINFINKNIINIPIFLFIFILLTYIPIASIFHVSDLFVHWAPFNYGYMFLLGGLSYIVKYKYLTNINHFYSNFSYLFYISTLIFIIVIYNKVSEQTIGQLVAISTAIFICFAKDNSKLSILFTNKAFLFLGSISYSFYLIHIIVLTIIGNYSQFSVIEQFTLSFFLTVLISFISFKFLESYVYKKIKIKIKKI